MQVKDVNYGKTVRKSYAKYQEILQMPNLLKIQKDSYDWFLREGLHEVFRDVAAISDYTGNLELSFLDYSLDEKPKYTIEECKERDATYAKPIKVRVRLLNKQSGEIKDQAQVRVTAEHFARLDETGKLGAIFGAKNSAADVIVDAETEEGWILGVEA